MKPLNLGILAAMRSIDVNAEKLFNHNWPHGVRLIWAGFQRSL